MKERSVITRVSLNVFENVQSFEKAGFIVETDSDNSEQIWLTLPSNWRFVKTDIPCLQHIIDDLGNIRGAFISEDGFSYAYLRCRYEISTEPINGNGKFEHDTEKIILIDRGDNDSVIAEFGSCERYSDYEKDLLNCAERYLNQKFPLWKEPTEYWV